MTLTLFEGYGIEIEYMIVDRDSLAVKPIADVLLREAVGHDTTELIGDAIDWSNELTLHLIELKTHGPAASLERLGAEFANEVLRIDALLDKHDARLLPTAMHPSMDPHTEMRLWPHENNPIYEAYHRIFDCRGHGWANLQSVHLNLPFASDEELWRLHSATRLVLPLVPALAASSPFVEGKLTGKLDNRVTFYAAHVERVPALMGDVIPEVVRSRAEYDARILEPIYAALAPKDPEGTLREEWANARGAIARFDRMALELRLTDVQEHPRADVAVAALIAGAVRTLVAEGRLESYDSLESSRLRTILSDCATVGDEAPIADSDYLEALGVGPEPRSAGEIWRTLYDRTMPSGSTERAAHGVHLEPIFERGVLARRIARATGGSPSSERVRDVYRALADCLVRGESFLG
ncbi:MAG: glutamate--cysteine ligase [Polyangiaceae bacterium]|nr:glutamate--cysteine ligase [Polyangiaceae bacterium]